MMDTDGAWKIALNEEGQAYLLFDLTADPGETENLVGRSGTEEIVARLERAILRRLCRTQFRARGSGHKVCG